MLVVKVKMKESPSLELWSKSHRKKSLGKQEAMHGARGAWEEATEGPGVTRPPQPPRYLFLASAIVIHAVLGGHGNGGV